MDFLNLVTELAQQSKYFLLFIVFLLEGPVAGFISAFVATTWQLNMFIIFPLLILAEVLADMFFYYLGKRLSDIELNKKIKKYEQNNLLQVIKELLLTHPIRALIATKLIPVIAIPGLILIGKYESLKLRKYFLWVLIIGLLRNLVLVLLGYGLGVGIEDLMIGYSMYRKVMVIVGIAMMGYILMRAYQNKIEKVLLTVLKR